MSNAYNKSILREIKDSKGRFISIMLIILLGVAIYVGIKATGPNMKHTIQEYFNQEQLMDTRIVSSLGFDSDQVQLVRDNENVSEVTPAYFVDALVKDTNDVVRVHSFDRNSNINNLTVVDGRLPSSTGEIVLDFRMANRGYELGQTYTLDDRDDLSDKLQRLEFTVVGFVRSPLYVDNISRGVTTMGSGELDHFAYVLEQTFNMDVYTDLYVVFNNTQGLDGFSSDYRNVVASDNDQLRSLLDNHVSSNLQEIKDNISTIEDSIAQIDDGIAQLQGQLQWFFDPSPIQSQIDTLQSQKEELQGNLNDLQELANVEYMFFTRSDIQGYTNIGDSIASLDTIALVFPVFFFLVAMLICLSTMTRMVEEKRTEIGTLKALGYNDTQIARKYVVYAVIATLLGVLFGVIIGSLYFPSVIANAYRMMFFLPPLILQVHWDLIIQALVLSLLCTVGVALFVLKYDLREVPSRLMRPKAPKVGKKIFLERIPWIWNRLNFNRKVAVRNLIRYKQRMFMTILGISGCTALLIVGFALNNSNQETISTQFNDIWHYQAMVSLENNLSNNNRNNALNALSEVQGYDSSLLVNRSTMTISANQQRVDVTLLVTNTPEDFNNYITLFEGRNELTLNDNGVVITENIASFYHVKVGDTMTLMDLDNVEHQVLVEGIATNYVGSFIYMTNTYYQSIFDENPSVNAAFVRLQEDANQNDFVNNAMAIDHIVNVTSMDTMIETSQWATSSMDVIMYVIIIASGSLAFVVLYNLNSINISERIRELSTIKVLGMYDREVTQYINRENIILTFFGILVGCFLGNILYRFIIRTAMTTPSVSMIDRVNLFSYILAGLLTAVFAMIVAFITHIKLKNIDMIDALKTVE